MSNKAIIKCPHCKKGKLEPIKAERPYDLYYICNVCDSTYTIHEVKSRIASHF